MKQVMFRIEKSLTISLIGQIKKEWFDILGSSTYLLTCWELDEKIDTT